MRREIFTSNDKLRNKLERNDQEIRKIAKKCCIPNIKENLRKFARVCV